MSQQHDEHKMADALSFIFDSSFNEEIVKMDCNDYCEELAELAEQVANGAKLEDLLPDLNQHMQHWTDCREEFYALVAVLKAEQAEQLIEAAQQAQDAVDHSEDDSESGSA